MLIPILSSKIKLSFTVLIHTWKTFVADFLYDKVFYTLYLWLFFGKLKTSLKTCQNYIALFLMTQILMSWFKESTESRKTSFLKETVENADLNKALLMKRFTTQE